MSIEIRIECDRKPRACLLGSVQSAEFEDWCNHRLLTDWGEIQNAEADPLCGPRHLMLTTSDYIAQLLDEGPRPSARGGVSSATIDGDRLFAHLDFEGKRWTWELFEAHFADREGPANLLIGRWPD
jgi:hypothetical protein